MKILKNMATQKNKKSIKNKKLRSHNFLLSKLKKKYKFKCFSKKYYLYEYCECSKKNRFCIKCDHKIVRQIKILRYNTQEFYWNWDKHLWGIEIQKKIKNTLKKMKKNNKPCSQ